MYVSDLWHLSSGRGKACSILAWEWDIDSAAGAGNGMCLSCAAMSSSGHVKRWIDGEQPMRVDRHLILLYLLYI